MTIEKIYNILKINAGFELDTDKFGMGSIAKTFKPKHGQWPNNDVVGEYIYMSIIQSVLKILNHYLGHVL